MDISRCSKASSWCSPVSKSSGPAHAAVQTASSWASSTLLRSERRIVPGLIRIRAFLSVLISAQQNSVCERGIWMWDINALPPFNFVLYMICRAVKMQALGILIQYPSTRMWSEAVHQCTRSHFCTGSGHTPVIDEGIWGEWPAFQIEEGQHDHLNISTANAMQSSVSIPWSSVRAAPKSVTKRYCTSGFCVITIWYTCHLQGLGRVIEEAGCTVTHCYSQKSMHRWCSSPTWQSTQLLTVSSPAGTTP